MKTETDKIYVQVIDGANNLVPVNARQINSDQFEILDDPEYSDIDESVLFKFYPGDVVEVEDSTEPDNEYQYVAKKLISPSKREDRDYLEFKYRGTLRLLPINNSTVEKYKHVIQRIKKEKSEGMFFYRGIRETIDYLKRLAKI